ncbi:tetratricopeptide repeat protein [Methylopila sp. Yamaguchi]|uniref:tetratricopeptide repeat protein n=1 Tax=Methylopila sp. Yamaguchi TaxID=1437817 RepID=UPI000CBD01F7|nr:tetratricopeptide repeat protein [Methylopila sp. Yamaguchi]GBD46901.1 hypothetical protein METY_0114 [Methylopila sp. Yamaguchi]
MTFIDRRAAAFALVAALSAAPAAARETSFDIDSLAGRSSLAGAYLAGRVAGAQRDVDAAAAFFRAALKADPRNPQLLERAFLLSLAEGGEGEAMRLAERVVAADPTNRVAQLALAVRALKTGSYGSARSALERGARGPLADLSVALLSGWSWVGSNQPQRAFAALDKLQGADFFGAFRDYHAALIADLTGRKEEAEKRFAAALAGDGAALRVALAAASFRARNGDAAGALKALDDFEKNGPRHPLAREMREMIAQGRAPERVASNAQEGVAEVLYGIGGALARQGGEDLATVYLQLALYVQPEHPMALVTLADLYDQLNQYEDAIAVYERVPASSPLKRNADIQSAIDLDRLDKTDEAKARLAKLIAAAPDDQEALVALGNIERGREQFKEAAETYTKAINLISAAKTAEPAAAAPAAAAPQADGAPRPYVVKSRDSLWTLARDHLGDPKRWPELAAFNRANGVRIPRSGALAPGQTIVLPAPAQATAAATPATEPAAAPAAAEPAVANRADWSLYYVRGIAYERSKEWAKSEADLKKALSLVPDQPLVLNYLGYSWIDQGIHLDEGMKMIQRAVELRPDDGYIVDSLGWAHFKLGQFDDAVRELERAVELRPQDPVMNDHLGDAYWKVGRRLEAGFQWSHARDLNPEPEDLKKIEAKLKDGLPETPPTSAADAQEKKGGG